MTDTDSSYTLSPVVGNTKAPASTTLPTTETSTQQVNQNSSYSSPQEPADVGASKRDEPLSTGGT